MFQLQSNFQPFYFIILYYNPTTHEDSTTHFFHRDLGIINLTAFFTYQINQNHRSKINYFQRYVEFILRGHYTIFKRCHSSIHRGNQHTRGYIEK